MEFPGNDAMSASSTDAFNQGVKQLPDMSGTQATLFLFTPKEVIPQYRRSFNYRFDGNTINYIEDYFKQNNTIGGISYRDSKLGGMCASCILPSADADPINTRALENCWTFALILDVDLNPASKLVGSTRIVYTGYVRDTPVTFGIVSTLSSSDVRYNPDAWFIVTHWTKLNNKVTSIGDFEGGDNFRVDRALFDDDIIPCQLTQNLSMDSDNLFINTPTDLLKNSTDPVQDAQQMDTGSVNLTPIGKFARINKPTDAGFNSPTEHLSRIMTGLANSLNENEGNNISTGSKAAYRNQNTLNSWSDMIPDYSGNARNIGSGIQKEFPVDRPFSFEQLSEMWPGNSLDVKVIKQPEHYAVGGLDVRDTDGPSAQNIATAIITAALPTTLTNRLVTGVGLSYCSWENDGDMRNYKGTLRIHPRTMETLVHMNPVEYTNTMKLLARDIVDDIMLAVKSNFGDFRCDAYCSVTGDTVVNLILMDERYNESGVAINNNSLGGINSGMLGNDSQCFKNAAQLAELGQMLRPVPSFDFE